MKYTKLFLLLAALALVLCACQTATEEPSTSSTRRVHTLRMTDASPTEDTQDEDTFPAGFTVWRELPFIEVYPFTEQELANAAEVAERTIRGFFSGEGVLEYELKDIAFAPAMTDARVRQKLSADKSWKNKEDYYATTLIFAGHHSASYDHTKSPMQDTADGTVEVELCRDSVGEPWHFQEGSQGFHAYQCSEYAMSAEALKNYNAGDISGRLIAGYAQRDGSYDLYTVEEDGSVEHHLVSQ